MLVPGAYVPSTSVTCAPTEGTQVRSTVPVQTPSLAPSSADQQWGVPVRASAPSSEAFWACDNQGFLGCVRWGEWADTKKGQEAKSPSPPLSPGAWPPWAIPGDGASLASGCLHLAPHPTESFFSDPRLLACRVLTLSASRGQARPNKTRMKRPLRPLRWPALGGAVSRRGITEPQARDAVCLGVPSSIDGPCLFSRLDVARRRVLWLPA